jgi:phosphoglycerate dehydrogenase-like enzyme
MNVLVAVISPAPAWVMPRAFVDRLRRDFPQHTFLDAWDRDTIRALLPQADVAFTPFVDRDVFASATRLRWVQSPAVGVGSLMFPELLASDVVLTSARGIRARSIAEHVLTVTLALSRLLPLALRAQADHRWAQAELEGGAVDVRLVQGQRMGIIGLGAIGLEVAKLATPLGFRVTAIRRRTDQPVPDCVEAVWTPDRLRDLLAQSDVIVLAAPHTPDTKRLIGARELDGVKRGAFVINVARGKLVDDDALIAALRDGRVGGAALDVFSEEPLPASSPYWDMPNVIVTPHTSGALRDYWTPLVALFSDNLRRFESGKPLLNVVDKLVGY